MKPSPSPFLLAFGLVSACSCGEPPAPAGVRLDLLARRPDATFELPRIVLPQGDIPETITWGRCEGPGWSQSDCRRPDGTHYRETNQASASLVLPATRPEAREIVLALWCARAVGDEPAPVRVRLNGVELTHAPLALAREPNLVRLHAPEPAWALGPNQLELSVPIVERERRRVWDTLALASVQYGRPASVTLEPEQRLARFDDGTGARYVLELASPALLTFYGRSDGPGELRLRLGTSDRTSGAVSFPPEDARAVATAAGRLSGSLAVTPRPPELRALELEWYSPDGHELVLDELVAREETSPPRPPIVFVSIDTFAAAHLSLYGYGRETSPELERFQRDAVVFERCLANAPWTLPSYLSVMSGLYPRAHWVDLDFQEGAKIQSLDQFTLAPNRWSLAEALRARGYRTGGFVDTQWLSPQSGIDQGFDTYDGQAALAPTEDVHAGIELITKKLVPPWLERTSSDQPPFLFLHALDAHGPYLVEDPFHDTFFAHLPPERTEVLSGSVNQTYRTIPTWMGRTLVPDGEQPLPEKQPVEELVARYDETLLKVDAYLGQLFALLRARGLYDEAVIVVTGDHGEYFGPGMYGHGVMRETVLHVPLLLKLPHGAHGGEKVRAPVALVDVYPTLLELAGVPTAGQHLHGQSLLPCLRGEAPAERPSFSEGGHVEQYALTAGRWRLVEERPGKESADYSLLTHPRVPEAWLREHAPELLTHALSEPLLLELLGREGFREALAELRSNLAGPFYSLYDTEADPGDLRDRAAEKPEVVEALKPLLEAEKARSRQARAEAEPVFRPARSAAELQALDALGYGGVDGSDGEARDTSPPPQPGVPGGR